MKPQMTALLALILMSCSTIGCSDEQDEPQEDPAKELCREFGPCSFDEIDDEAMEASFELLDDLKRRFPEREQLGEAKAWLEAQPQLRRIFLDERNSALSFQLHGAPSLKYSFHQIKTTALLSPQPTSLSISALHDDRLSSRAQALSPEDRFQSSQHGVFTKNDRFERKALLVEPQHQVFFEYFEQGEVSQSYKQLKELHTLINEGTMTYKDRASLVIGEKILSYADVEQEGEGAVSGNIDDRKLVKAWIQAVKTFIEPWSQHELIYYSGHGSVEDRSKGHHYGKLKFDGSISLSLIVMEQGLCEDLLKALHNVLEDWKAGRVTSADIDWRYALWDVPECGSQTLKITSATDPDEAQTLTYDIVSLNTLNLLRIGVLPLRRQLLMLSACDIDNQGMPMTQQAGLVSSVYSGLSGRDEELMQNILKGSLSQGFGLRELVKDAPSLLKLKYDDGEPYEFRLDTTQAGLRVDESMTLLEPGWSDEKDSGMIAETWPFTQVLEAEGKQLNVPVFVVGPWEKGCSLEKPQMKFWLRGQDVKVKKVSYSAVKKLGPSRGQFMATLHLDRPLQQNATADLYAQYIYNGQASKCPSTDTVARARIKVTDLSCPTWSVGAGGSSFVGNHATLLGATDFYTLNFEILSRVTQDEEIGTGITGVAILYLDGRAEVTFTDQKFYWTTETPLQWIGDFDDKRRLIGSINGQITQTPYGSDQQTKVPFSFQFETLPVNQAAAQARCVNN